MKTILDWIAEASGAERSRRIEALNRLIEELKVRALQLERLRSPQRQKQADEHRDNGDHHQELDQCESGMPWTHTLSFHSAGWRYKPNREHGISCEGKKNAA